MDHVKAVMRYLQRSIYCVVVFIFILSIFVLTDQCLATGEKVRAANSDKPDLYTCQMARCDQNENMHLLRFVVKKRKNDNTSVVWSTVTLLEKKDKKDWIKKKNPKKNNTKKNVDNTLTPSVTFICSNSRSNTAFAPTSAKISKPEIALAPSISTFNTRFP